MNQKALLAVFVIVLVAAGGLLVAFYYPFQHAQPSAGQSAPQNPNSLGISVGLSITVTNNGTVVYQKTYQHDPVTSNFVSFVDQLLSPCIACAASLKNTAGASVNVYPQWNCPWYCYEGFNQGSGAEIQIGTGSGTPGSTDTNLFTPYQTPVAVDAPTYSSGGGTGVITVAGIITAATGAQVTESGLMVNWAQACYACGASDYNFLLYHDTFQQFAVTQGEVVTIQYTVSFTSGGLTDNFGNFMAGLFSSSAHPYVFTLKTTSGSTGTFNMYVSGSQYSSFGGSSQVEVGTGSTSAAPAQYALASAAGGATGANTPSVVGTTVVVTGSVTPSSQTNIAEGGFFLSSYMMFRIVYSTPLNNPANKAATVTFTVSL